MFYATVSSLVYKTFPNEKSKFVKLATYSVFYKHSWIFPLSETSVCRIFLCYACFTEKFDKSKLL